MRAFRIALVGCFGFIAVWLELRTIRVDTIFWGDDEVAGFFLWITILLSIGFLIAACRRLRAKPLPGRLAPALVGLLCVGLVLGHRLFVDRVSASATLFEAYNGEIGSDGGCTMQFKANGCLLVTKVDHFACTQYRGWYRRTADSVWLDILLDFPLRSPGAIGGGALEFYDQEKVVTFSISKP